MKLYADSETFLIGPRVQAPPPVCLQVGDDTTALRPETVEVIHARDTAFRPALVELFANHTSYFHNAAFDMCVFAALDQELTDLVFEAYAADRIICTQTREKLILIAQGTFTPKTPTNLGVSLERRAPAVVVDKSDPWRKRYGTLYDTPVSEWPAEALHYARMDVVAEKTLADAQEPYLHLFEDQYRQARADLWMKLTTCWGLRTNSAAVRTYHQIVLEDLERDKQLCLEHGLVRRDGTRDTKLAGERAETAYRQRGLVAPRANKGKGKGPALDADALEKSWDPVLMAYARFGSSGLLLGKADRLRWGVIQPQFNALVNTGRTSVSQGSEPEKGEAASQHGAQVQNLPSDVCSDVLYTAEDGRAPRWSRGRVDEDKTKELGRKGWVVADFGYGPLECEHRTHHVSLAGAPGTGIRECYVARPGTALVSVDMNTYELRTWAQCCLWMVGYSDLANVLNDPKRDPHVEMGARLNGISIEQAYALKALDEVAYKALRGVAKGPNFGLPGGMGAERLVAYCWDSYRVKIDLDTAKRAIVAWKETWSEAKPYLNLIGRMTQGEFNSIVQHRSGRVRGDMGYCDAANGFFQGLAADAIKDAGFHLSREMNTVKSSPLYGARIVNFIHDEFLTEVPLDRLHEAAWRQAEIQRSVCQSWIPDVLVSCEPAAMKYWSKAVGEVYKDAAGKACKSSANGARLQVWLPETEGLPWAA